MIYIHVPIELHMYIPRRDVSSIDINELGGFSVALSQYNLRKVGRHSDSALSEYCFTLLVMYIHMYTYSTKYLQLHLAWKGLHYRGVNNTTPNPGPPSMEQYNLPCTNNCSSFFISNYVFKEAYEL